MGVPATERGRETRERIVLSADRLFRERGVAATSVDDVLAVAGAGKGQLYRYFESKDELVSAVVDHRLDRYLVRHLAALERLETLDELRSHLDELVEAHRANDLAGGCPVGSLALELTGRDEPLRRRLAGVLDRWETSLCTGLERLAARAELRDDVPPERLAGALLASIQGAYLLSTVRRDADSMSGALHQAVKALRPDCSLDDREPGGRY
jgi:AcrR family transcriptional regulator